MALDKGIAALKQYQSQFDNTDLFPAASEEDITAAQLRLKNALGLTDYSTQSEAAKNTARLNMALALAQRGYEMAGAAPREGESPISTMSRAIAPLAGDVRATASDYMKQKAAFDLAKQQEERQLKMMGYQSAQDRLDKQSSALVGLLPELIKSDKVTRSLQKAADFSAATMVDGERIAVKGTGPLSITTNTVTGDVTAQTATQIRTTDEDGKEHVLPAGTIVASWMSPEKTGTMTLWENPTNTAMTFELSGGTVTIPAGGTQHLTNEELYEARNEFPEVAGQLRKWDRPEKDRVPTVFESKLFTNRSDEVLNITRNGVDISIPPGEDVNLDKKQFSEVQLQLDKRDIRIANVLVPKKDPKREGGISYGQIVSVGDDGKTTLSDAQQLQTSTYFDQNSQIQTQVFARKNNRGEWLEVDPANVMFLPEDQEPWAKTKDLYAPEGVIPGAPRGDSIEVWTSAAKTPAGTQQTRYRHKGKWIDLSEDTVKALSDQELTDWADTSTLYVPRTETDTGAGSALIPGTNIEDPIEVKTRPDGRGGLQTSYWHAGKQLNLTEDVIRQLLAQNPDPPAAVKDLLYVHDETAARGLGPNVATNAEISSITETKNGVQTTRYLLGGMELSASKVQELINSGALQTAKKPAVGESKQFVYTGPDTEDNKFRYNQKMRLRPDQVSALPQSVQDHLAELSALDRNQQHHMITREIKDKADKVIWTPGEEWYGDQQQATAFREKHGQDVLTTWDKAKGLLTRKNTLQNVFTALVAEKYGLDFAAHKDFKLTEIEKDGILGKFPAVGRSTLYAAALRTELLDLLSRKLKGRKPAEGVSQKDADASNDAAEQIVSDNAARAKLTQRTEEDALTHSEMSENSREKARTRPDTGWDALYDRGLVAETWAQLSFERKQAFSLIGANSPDLKDDRKVAAFIDDRFKKFAERKAQYAHPNGEDVAEYENLIRVYATLKQIRDGGYLRDTGIITGAFAKHAGGLFADWPLDLVFDEDTERLTVLMSQLRSSIEFINQSEARPSDYRAKIKLDILPKFVRAQSINEKNVALALDNLENHIQSYFDPSVTATKVVPPAFEQAASQVGIEVTPTARAKYPWIDFDSARPIFLMEDFLEGIGVRRAGWAQFEATYPGDPVLGLEVPDTRNSSGQTIPEFVDKEYPRATGVNYIRLNENMVKKYAKNPVNEGLEINSKGAYVIMVIKNGGPNGQDLYIPKMYDMSKSFGKRGGD